jgi:hypothetical protein
MGPDAKKRIRSRVLRDVALGPSVETGTGVPGYSGGLAACMVFSCSDLEGRALFLNGSGRLLDASFFEDVEGDAKIAVAIVVAAVIVFLAAIETGGASAQWTDSFEEAAAVLAAVGEFGAHLAAFEGKAVAAWFTGDSEVGAGLPPFGTVGGDASAAGAVHADEVGEFVAKDSLDDGGSVVFEAWINFHLPGAGAGGAGGGLEA